MQIDAAQIVVCASHKSNIVIFTAIFFLQILLFDKMDEIEVIDDDDNSFEPPTKKLKLDWEGFLRAKKGNIQRRNKAKCPYCHKIFNGTIPNLRDHKATCNLMPAIIRGKITTTGRLDNRRVMMGVGDSTVAVGPSLTTQENLDGLLCKAVVGGDVSFR